MIKSTKSLKARSHVLSDTEKQSEILNNGVFDRNELPKFREKLGTLGFDGLKTRKIEIIQINLGYMCNQTCKHCHVDAGPDRKEIMSQETMQQCLDIIKTTGAHTLDLTGGAPEMNPNFRWFVEEASKLGVKDFIVRSNLTIIRANKKYYDLPEFFKKHNVHVVSSMPHWTRGKTDKQRGEGVFNKSIEALKMLNDVGYGMPNSKLRLDLVYNPSGAFLPGDQMSLEKDFKKALLEDFNIQFHNLFAITNLPISRFLENALSAIAFISSSDASIFICGSNRKRSNPSNLTPSISAFAVSSIMVSIEIGGSESGPLPTTPGQEALCSLG